MFYKIKEDVSINLNPINYDLHSIFKDTVNTMHVIKFKFHSRDTHTWVDTYFFDNIEERDSVFDCIVRILEY